MDTRALPHTDVVELIRHLAASPAVEHSPDLQTELVQWSRLLRRSTRLDNGKLWPLQERILKALDGKALRTDDLARACGLKGSSQLFHKKTGLPPLIRARVISHSEAIGYFRPDAKPKENTGDGVTQSKRVSKD